VAYVWGAGDGGQLGTGTQECGLLPKKFPVPSEVSHIGCGYGFTIAAKADSHSLWTTGLNSFSQLARQLSSSNGQVESGPSTVDLSVNTSLSLRVQQISCGRSHSAVLMDNGEGTLYTSDRQTDGLTDCITVSLSDCLPDRWTDGG